VMGYCFGGAAALELAHSGEAKNIIVAHVRLAVSLELPCAGQSSEIGCTSA
jgi:dienelactone hydrolase